jgi:hypothetical protein
LDPVTTAGHAASPERLHYLPTIQKKLKEQARHDLFLMELRPLL